MSWYLLPSGQPWEAADGSSKAEELLERGATVLYDPVTITAAIAAWATRTPGPGGVAANFVTYTQLLGLLAELTPGGGGNAEPDLEDTAVLLVTTGGGWSVDPNDAAVLIAA